MTTLTPSNFHPILSVPLAEPVLTTPAQCEAYVLVSLPPALFVDPWQAPVSVDVSGRIAETHFLGGSAADVELEKAVGWTTDVQTVGRKGSAGASASASGSTSNGPHGSGSRTRQYENITKKKWVAGEGIVEETIKVLAEGEEENDTPHQLNTYSPPSKSNRRERESVLFKLATKQQDSTLRKVIKSVVGSSDDEEEELETQIDIPLHARYLPPVDGGDASIHSLFQSVQSLDSGAGNYHDVSIEGLEVFWACTPSRGIGASSEISSHDDGWEKVIRPSSLLPPSHKHHTNALHTTLPHKATLYRRTDVGIPDSMSLPTGDSSYASLTMSVTQSVVWVLTILLVVKVWRVK